MNGIYISVAVSVLLAIALAVVAFMYLKLRSSKTKEISQEEAIEQASSKAGKIIQDAKDEAAKIKTEADKNANVRVEELNTLEKRLQDREKVLLERSTMLDKRFDSLESKERDLEASLEKAKQTRLELEGKLEEIAKLTREEAKRQLLEQVEKDISNDIAKRLREAEEKVKFEADEVSKNILVDAMQKSATDYVAETTVTTVEIANDDMKGRIIGKEGRNIKTFERLTGVDIIVDDIPGVITISCFDPIRREVAAIAMQRLLKDGRVHPGTIEEMVHKVKVDIAKEIKKTGEEIAYEAGFPNLPEEVIKLLGRFKYRFSYGQNLVRHTMEMVKLGSYIASELEADVELTKLACLLHDIGKVLTTEVEGKPHHHISGDIVRKYKMGDKLANAVESHHGDIEAKSVEAIIVYVADAISGARPGARRDNYEEYVKRVTALEETATSFDGVKEAYAIHAGREVRVICKSDETSDEDVKVLASKIAKEIEKTQTYPGQVKVNVIREVRAAETAK